MNTQPIRLGPDSTVHDTLKSMTDHRDDACVMIDEDERVIGILTPRELMGPLLGLQVDEELPVYIMGLDNEDFFEKSIAEEKLRKVVAKSLKSRPDITEVSVRIKSGQSRGTRTRYEVTARALTSDGQINAKAEGWDLTAVFDEVGSTLGKAIQRTKPERSPRSRRRGRRSRPS